MTGRLAGKIAVITGTAGGQGRAAALLFAGEGATVIGCDIQESAETVDMVRSAGGSMTSTDPLDLTDDVAVAAWMSYISDTFGRIDILYVNAATTRFSAIGTTPHSEWRFVLDHELDLVFLPINHGWELLKKSATPAIVLVGSTAGVSGSVTNTRLAHTATKGAVVAMTKQLAAEGAKFGIRANCVSPGMIRTPATEGDLLAADHPMRSIASAIPLQRIGSPEEVVRCALFLASDDASYVTGANLMVDGGWSAVLPG